MRKTYQLAFWGIVCILSMSSCVSYGELLNFTEGPEFPTAPEDIPMPPAIRVQPDDELAISVHNSDPQLAIPYNMGREDANAAITPGLYLVDDEGNIDYPGLGQIKVGGLTITEVKQQLIVALKTYLLDPIVTVRFTQFRFTVLGEVNAPGTLTLPEEKITILQAIGLTGDLTDYGDRRNILIIREQDGKRMYGNLNLQDRKIFTSPYFYLYPNDFVYVRPNKTRTATVRTQAQNIVPWVAALTSFATLIVSISR